MGRKRSETAEWVGRLCYDVVEVVEEVDDRLRGGPVGVGDLNECRTTVSGHRGTRPDLKGIALYSAAGKALQSR